MPEDISGYQNTTQTLSPGTPAVTISGTINAYGPAGVYTINTGKGPGPETFSAAVLGPQTGDFTVTNTGFILTQAGNPANLADAGILLANSGRVYNSGTVVGASGIGILAQSGPAYIDDDRGTVFGTIGVGIAGFDGPVTLRNSGYIYGEREGVLLTAGGVITNASGGFIQGIQSYGIDTQGVTTITNAGGIEGFYGGINLESGQGTVINTNAIFVDGHGSTQFYGGILTSDGGTVFNSGDIQGENGIAVQYSAPGTPGFSGYAENSGLIRALTTLGQGSLGLGGEGGFGVGIAMNMPGTVVNAGHIIASNAGIISQNNNTAAVYLRNAASGTISSPKYGIYLRSGGDATNAGTIVAGEQGMTDISGGTLVNRGVVEAYSAPFTVANASGTYIPTGLYLRGSGNIVNQAGGVVSVASGDGMFLQGVDFGKTETLLDGEITNAGTVQAFEGVYETSLGTFTNSGFITATQAGFLSPHVSAIVFNTGTILASTTLGVLDSRANGFLNGGIGVYADGGTVTNAALISGNHAAVAVDSLTGLVLNQQGASLASALGYGVILSGGGGVVNQGAISGYRAGIRDQNDSATVVNFGYIGAAGSTFTTTGTGSSHGLPAGSYVSQGVLLKDGGDVFNAAGATISGQTGVNIAFAAYVENAGLIDGRGRTGVYLKSGGTVVNQGSIHGDKHAVEFYTGAGELVNAGTISGGPTGDAVSFAAGFDNLLVVDPGARFIGQVDGGDSLSSPGFSVLELGVGDGTLQNIGTQFTGFTTIDFAPGAEWTVAGNTAGLAGGELIRGFAAGDVLDISSISVTPQVLTIGADGVLYVPESLGTLTLHFTDEAGQTVRVSGDGGTGADIVLESAPCFCAGTRIRTARGEVAVEDLIAGDLLVTAAGALRPIRWIGRREYDGRFIAGNHLMLPVRIAAGALSEGVPHHDLWVSPGHALQVGGALVPAWRLINGETITQAETVDQVRYFHVELESHDVILAENCPTESYLDDGGRAQFQNGAQVERLDRPGLPRTESGPVLDAIQRRLGVRPVALSGRLRGFVDAAGPGRVSGWAQDIANPDAPVWLDICLDGRRVRRVLANTYRADLRAAGLGAGCHGFELEVPAGPVTVRSAATGEVLRMTERALRAA